MCLLMYLLAFMFYTPVDTKCVMSVCLSVCLSVCRLSVCLSVWLSVCLPVLLSVCQNALIWIKAKALGISTGLTEPSLPEYIVNFHVLRPSFCLYVCLSV